MVEAEHSGDEPKGARKEFLLQMHGQLFNDIDRHLTVVWQAAGVVAGAFAVFALTEKEIISQDIAVTLVVLLCGWMVAHVIDAAYWYNRNLLIITNIERLFLRASDLQDVMYYFGTHRPENKMITHLRIQRALGLTVLSMALVYHVYTRVIPGLSSPLSSFEWTRLIPYLFAFEVFVYLLNLREKGISDYEEAKRNSPGIPIELGDVRPGGGHGYGKSIYLLSPITLIRQIRARRKSSK